VAAQTAFAGTDPRDTKNLGELLVANKAMVEEAPATTGLTIVSGSRIKTLAEGRAIVNLGKVGRVTLGGEADLVLNFTESGITGHLVSGWMIVSTPKGVSVAVKTVDGTVVADGDQSSVLKIDVLQGTTRVEAEGGGGQLQAAEKTEFVAAGEEVELSREDGTASFARRTLPVVVASSEGLDFAKLAAASLRGALETVTLNRTLIAPPERTLKGGLDQGPFGSETRINAGIEQLISCPGADCADCGLQQGQIVKAKAGCVLGFAISFRDVAATQQVSVRPFFSSACFRIFPGSPQTVTIPGGGASFFQIDARNCPRNAFQIAANSLLVVQSNVCGTQYVQVEWATPCR
jgi:hypothetical protein